MENLNRRSVHGPVLSAVAIWGLLPLLVASLRAADTLPLPHFSDDEHWAADSSVVGARAPSYTVTAGADGLTVAFPVADAESKAVITSTRWKVSDPIAVAPTHLVLDVSTDATNLQVAPILVDAEGANFALTQRAAAGGALQWDLPADSKKAGQQPGAVITGDGKTPISPVYLKEIQIVKAAGGAASIKFKACTVSDNANPPKPMALASDVLWKFDQAEGWVDLNNQEEGRAQYDLSYGPGGTTIIFKPRAKGVLTLKLATLTQLHDGQFGHARRIITHVDYDGPADTAFVGLGMKDAEREVVATVLPDTHPPAFNTPLAPGSNQIIWDAANVRSPWRGKHNGYVDFPLNLDDFTLNMRPSSVPIKVVFRGATIESWQPLVRAMGVDAGRPRFIWAPGEKATVSITLKNIGAAPFAREMQFAFKDDLEHELWSRNVHATVPPNGEGRATIEFETQGLPQGVYLLEWASPQSTDGIKGVTMVTVADDKPLPKSGEGEFVFGMDMGVRWNQDPALDWAQWCGVDMIRSAGRDPYFLSSHIAEFQDAVAACAKHGIRSQMLLWPGTPWDPDKAKFEAKIKESADFAGRLASALKDTGMHWYEIGNEPSLTFFFHGPPADFVQFFVAVRDAIKAADPQATVTVGGLAFAGMAGAETRANQIVQLMPLDKIDGFGYHGHGEGAKAERFAFENMMRRMAKAAGKDTKPYYETESGVTSTDSASWREQARTVIQKFAYAQSTHLIPSFMWFGFHPNWEWGILQTLNEAKPAALAYRVYVQNARHLVGQDRLDLAGAQGEAYWFKPKDPGDARFMMVLWSDVGEYTRMVNIGKNATDVRQMDLFGNAKPLPGDADGVVQLNVDLNPIYVLANRPPADPAPIVLPPALDLPKEVRVVPGTTDTLKLTVTNVSSMPLSARLTVKPAGGAPIGESQASVSANPKGRVPMEIPLKIADRPVDWWPRAWVVFAPVIGDVDITQFNALPDVLTIGNVAVHGQPGTVDGSTLDIAPLGQGHAERKQALCFATIGVDRDTDATIGISADFWMEFYINGKLMLSTMSAGNGGSNDLLRHLLPIHLHKGDNLLAARILSGSGGWKLTSGGPETVAAAQRAKSGTMDAAVVELIGSGKLLARESVRLLMLPPLAPMNPGTSWDRLAPDAAFGHVDNLFMKQPDSSRWYHGPADLSGKVWIRMRSDGSLIIAAAVRDDIDKPKDAIVIRLASGEGWKNRLELRSGRDDIKRRRDDPAAITWYEAVIPASALSLQPRQKLAINVIAEDDDWGELKQRTALAPGDDPALWYETWRR